uniref:Uncharacterized protein n=1 Tax=Steinernema glaseri TaxID=37863 RepID=A0A1I7Z9N2_9BILA
MLTMSNDTLSLKNFNCINATVNNSCTSCCRLSNNEHGGFIMTQLSSPSEENVSIAISDARARDEKRSRPRPFMKIFHQLR